MIRLTQHALLSFLALSSAVRYEKFQKEINFFFKRFFFRLVRTSIFGTNSSWEQKIKQMNKTPEVGKDGTMTIKEAFTEALSIYSGLDNFGGSQNDREQRSQQTERAVLLFTALKGLDYLPLYSQFHIIHFFRAFKQCHSERWLIFRQWRAWWHFRWNDSVLFFAFNFLIPVRALITYFSFSFSFFLILSTLSSYTFLSFFDLLLLLLLPLSVCV